MARLLTWNDGLGLNALELVDGPNVRNSGSTTAQDGSEQTFDSLGDVWTFRLGLTIKQGREARRQRGIIDALLGGANAMRYTVIDPDMMSPQEAGIDVPITTDWSNIGFKNWSNGQPWSNGLGWKITPPVVSVSASAAVDTDIVRLDDQFWGHSLDLGDRFGFFPFHFGMYQVTEVVEPGLYRVKYRLRRAISATDYATLRPTLVLRPVNKSAARSPARNPSHTEEANITLAEVIDPYVRQHFTD